MIRTIIVADDMTGANVSSSLLAKKGIKVGSLINYDDIDHFDEYEAFGVHTDSRGIPSEEAYTRVNETVKKLTHLPVKFFNKRIDSTLRGNVGREIDGMLDALAGNEMAFVVSAFPSSHKIVVGGYMLINGTPLEKTDVANDPTSPVNTSIVQSVIDSQTKYKSDVITIGTVLSGQDAILARIQALKEAGVRIISFDASTNDEIDIIAKAVLASKLPFVSVDPGPFTEAIVKNLGKKGDMKEKQKSLFLIGSVSTIAIEQIAKLRSEYKPYIVKIEAKQLLDVTQREQEINRCVDKVLSNLEDHQLFLVATRIEIEDKLDLQAVATALNMTVQEASETISDGVATIGKKIVDRSQGQFGAFYTSGGDTTTAFLQATSTQGIEIKDEIIPLAVYGTVMAGDLNGKSIITKGGLIGDSETLVQCANYLQTKISTKHM